LDSAALMLLAGNQETLIPFDKLGDSWIKIDQLMSLASFFAAQHLSNASTFIFRSLRLCVGILLWFDVSWRYGVVRLVWCGILMQARALVPTRGYNITQSSASDDGHMVARNMFNNYSKRNKEYKKWHLVGFFLSTFKNDKNSWYYFFDCLNFCWHYFGVLWQWAGNRRGNRKESGPRDGKVPGITQL
jgi:hypothetical protein